MMYKSRAGKYVAAGVQKSPAIMIDVRSNVHLPDSEAGASWYDPNQKPFYAETVMKQKRGPLTLTRNSALIFLCALFVVFGAMVLTRVAHKASLTKHISEMQQAIEKIQKSNRDLEIEVSNARDIARIGYKAQNELYMVDASSAETVAVHAPDTRPFGEESTVVNSMKTGSR